MSFDTSWNVDKYKSDHESEEHWQFRRAFLIKHKNKYQEDRLASLAQIFFNVEFLGCRYPQQTMDLIESLSKGLVDDFRNKRKGKLQRTFVVASDAAMSKAKGIRQSVTSNINNKSQMKTIIAPTPYHPEHILPGFMLTIGNSEDPIEILDRSCSFCNMAKPLVKFDQSNSPTIKADLYINNKLIASGSGTSQKIARKDVSKNAYHKLKDICFTIKIKEHQENEFSINKPHLSDVGLINNSKSLASNINEIIENDKLKTKLPENNIGNKLLKNMGWKEGHGLGKNSQGRLEPIEIVQLPKNMGLGNKKTPVGESARQKIMFALQREIKIHIKEFINSKKKKLTFSTEFTKEERKLIHVICLKFGLKTKSYGQNENRHIVISRKENSQEVFEELINNGLENDYYKLIPPKNVIF